NRRYAAGWDQLLIYQGRTSHSEQHWRLFPVLGVSGDEAAAYAAWLDRSKKVPGARLCSEVEWERAARGADGRGYPAGHPLERDDANLDFTHGTGRMGPDEVGSHPESTSPFGLVDMCGNAFELALSEKGGYIIRGGSYQHDRRTAHLTDRGAMDATIRDAAVG